MTEQVATIELALARMMRLGTNTAMTLLGLGLFLRYGSEIFGGTSQESLRAELDSLGRYRPLESGAWIQAMLGHGGVLESISRGLLIAGVCALLVLPSFRLLFSAYRLKIAHETRLALTALVIFGLILTGLFLTYFSH
jgi:hypothetical protein